MSNLLNALNGEKQEYYRLKETLSQTASYLQKSYNSLEIPANLENYYSIDDTSFDGYSIKNNRDKIQNKISFLTGQAVSEIDSEINRINNAIREEERRIEEERKREERRRREEEERRKREEAAKEKAMASNPFAHKK